MPINPILLESLAANRSAEARRPHMANPAATRSTAMTNHRSRRARTRAGWLLIGIGMHLALPGARATNRVDGIVGR
jgi:hypothetical protein